MFNLFKKHKKIEDLTATVSAIAEFLIDDSGLNFPTPLRGNLKSSNLNYSLESLKVVDSYLDEVRNNRKNLTDEQILKIVVRCGSYCGEVIRKSSQDNLIWINYKTASAIDPKIKSFGESPYTFYVLFTEPNTFYFPLAKVGKYIESGPEDSLYLFASEIIH